MYIQIDWQAFSYMYQFFFSYILMYIKSNLPKSIIDTSSSSCTFKITQLLNNQHNITPTLFSSYNWSKVFALSTTQMFVLQKPMAYLLAHGFWVLAEAGRQLVATVTPFCNETMNGWTKWWCFWGNAHWSTKIILLKSCFCNWLISAVDVKKTISDKNFGGSILYNQRLWDFIYITSTQ